MSQIREIANILEKMPIGEDRDLKVDLLLELC